MGVKRGLLVQLIGLLLVPWSAPAQDRDHPVGSTWWCRGCSDTSPSKPLCYRWSPEITKCVAQTQPQPPLCVNMKNDPLNLKVDAQLRSINQNSYNCFHYVRTFVEGEQPALPLFVPWWDKPNSSEIEGPNPPLNFRYLENQGYQRQSTGTSLQAFRAKLGDIVTVENPPLEQLSFPYSHGAIVVQVSAEGQIIRLRQKVAVNKCVMDMDPVTFMTKFYGLVPGYRYELWRNPKKQGLLPRTN